MITSTPLSHAIAKAERDMEPVVNSKDPENFLKRCSGYSKKTNMRCSASIGKKAQKEVHLTYLPTCSAHRDQQSLAGWCQFRCSDGEACGRLFRWSPPYFELCANHQGHPSTPCYFLKQLPLELRHEIYRYLLPTRPIDSSTAVVHDQAARQTNQATSHAAVRTCGPYPRTTRSKFPMPLLDLLMVSRQVYAEVKHLLFSIVTFKIDVRKDGTFMCGRRLLEPKRADGSSHFFFGQADHAKKKFLKCFDWASAKNYAVDILLENCPIANPHHAPNNVNMTMKTRWDEEVEIYDIRDYISVVVSGILAKATKLNKLQVRLCIADFFWDRDQVFSNSKLLFSPFERLRNVRQPNLTGVYNGRPESNSMYPIERGTGRYPITTPHGCMHLELPAYYELCSVPSVPTDEPILFPGMPEFDTYNAKWTGQISSPSSINLIQEPLIRRMFTEFRNFYTELSNQVPDITLKTGRNTFLHRARVAREQEDVLAFRAIRKELLEYWDRYLDIQEQKKHAMEARITKFLQSDVYPSHIWEDTSATQEESLLIPQEPQPPVGLDSDVIARDGIPMTGNTVRQGYHQSPYQQMSQHQAKHNPFAYPMLPVQQARDLNSSNQQHLQAQILQREVIRQQMQMKQLQQSRQYSPACATLRQQDCMRQPKGAEANETNDQASYPVQQSDGETAQSRGPSSNSQSKHKNFNTKQYDGRPHTLSISPMTGITSSRESDAGPSTKRRRLDHAVEDAGTDFASEKLKDSGLKRQCEEGMICDIRSPACGLHVMDESTKGKGKGKT